MTKEDIQKQAQRVSSARARLTAEEQRLSLKIWSYLKPRGSMRDLAKQLSISPQYLCDIAHGRRKISGPVIDKVVAL